MKKYIVIFVLLMGSMCLFAQLQMSHGDRTIAKSNYVFLKNGELGYYVDIKDYRSANFVTLKLGPTLNQSTQSLEQLQSWFKTNKVGESVLLEQSDGQLTIYKASPTLLLVSKASAETCRLLIKV